MNAAPDWEENVVRPVMNCAGPYPEVFLQILVRRLEARPDATLDLIGAAMEDMAEWYSAQAAGLEAVGDLRRIAKEGNGEAAH